MTDSRKSLGRYLCAARRRIGITQKALSIRLAGSRRRPLAVGFLSKIETGQVRVPDELVCRYAAALDLDANYLFYLSGRLPPCLRGLDAVQFRHLADHAKTLAGKNQYSPERRIVAAAEAGSGLPDPVRVP